MPRPARAVGRQTIKSSIGRGVARTGGRLVSNLSRRSAMVLVNLLRAESRVAVLAVLRGVTRVLMANLITAVITLIAFTLYDSIFFFRRERSGKQFLVNLLSNIWVISCGTGVFIIWEIAASPLFGEDFWSGVLNFVLGFALSVIICLVAGFAFDKVVSKFYMSDTDRMLAIIGEEYERTRMEKDLEREDARALLGSIEDLITPKVIRRMFRSEDRSKFAQELITEAEAALSTGE
ncbi:MAG: hypothetical protein II667_03065 [Clostridiales bacterium]|nr:hypothetical protein [Clostridiales bacterium]MBQ4190310.1 hypothetical protein [Clostridiales bacterium]MBQ4217061.1 hypothetical protein [Clostridiales bacterium]